MKDKKETKINHKDTKGIKKLIESHFVFFVPLW